MPMLRCLPLAFMPPKLPCQPLTHHVLANHWLAMLPLCSAPLIALLVAAEDKVCSMLEHGYCWDIINISYLLNASIYLVKGGWLAFCLVFCSTLAALVSVIPVLCSRILRSLRGYALWIKLLRQGPTLVLPFASPPPTFPLGVINPRVIFIIAPPGPMLV